MVRTAVPTLPRRTGVLALAAVLDVAANALLKKSDGFRHRLPGVLALVLVLGAFGLLGLALRSVPLATAYATWGAVGLVLTDPGAPEMFEDWVYKRGALTVEALRHLLGTDLFGSMLRAWVREHRFGTVDSLGLRTHVHAWAPHAGVSRAQVDELFDAWTLRPELPPFPG